MNFIKEVFVRVCVNKQTAHWQNEEDWQERKKKVDKKIDTFAESALIHHRHIMQINGRKGLNIFRMRTLFTGVSTGVSTHHLSFHYLKLIVTQCVFSYE